MSPTRPEPAQSSDPLAPLARREPPDAPAPEADRALSADPASPPIFAGDAHDIAQDQRHRADPHADATLDEGRRFGGRGGFLGVLIGGARALALLRVRPGAIPVSAGGCAALIFMSIAIAIAGDALLLGPEVGEFNWLSLRAIGLDLLLIVLGGAWLVEQTRRGRPTPLPGVATDVGAGRGPATPARSATDRSRRSVAATRAALQSVLAPASELPPAPRQHEPTIAEHGPDTSIRLASPVRAALPHSGSHSGSHSAPRSEAVPAPASVSTAAPALGETRAAATGAREPIPPLHFATVCLAGGFWLLLLAYAITIWLASRADAGLPSVVPGMWFYNLTTIWPWLIAIRAIQAMHRYQPLSSLKRALLLIAMLVSIGWTLFDPGEPYWVAPYEVESDELPIPGMVPPPDEETQT